MIFTTAVTFIIIFGLLIFLHELGHFMTARKFGVRVEEFGFGLPPRMIGWHKQEGRWQRLKTNAPASGTIYSLNWIPFGGFVKLYGEEGAPSVEKDSFAYKGKLQRVIILSAGVAMNVLFAAVLMSAGFMMGTPSVIDNDISPRARVRDIRIQVTEVLRDSPAVHAGITPGDTIDALNGAPVASITEFQDGMQQCAATSCALRLRTIQGEIRETQIVPTLLVEGEGKQIIGVGLIRTGIVSYPWYLAVPEGVRATGALARNLLEGFGHIIKNLVSTGHSGAVVSGPLGIAVLTGQVASLGVIYLMQFAATLSLNLAIINYVPFPALDGGRVFFILIEALRGKAISKKFETAFHTAGFALLIVIIVFITFKDIARYGGWIIPALRNILN